MPRFHRAVGVAGAFLIAASSVGGVFASSHREAPLISTDPGADSTDLYAFVDPVDATKVDLIANYIPMEDPAGGPNFWLFDPNVRYEINVDNNGDGKADITYRFTFKTIVRSGATFLYNTNQVTSPSDPDLNVRQTYTLTRVTGGEKVLASNLPVAPANVGARSNPDYAATAAGAIKNIRGGIKSFAGQRDDPFFVDLGSIFDLGGLRPFNQAHLIPLDTAAGVDDLAGLNVHSIALQVPIENLTRDGFTHPASDARSVIGVWTSAWRQQTSVLKTDGTVSHSGRWVQVSRLANPLINEVIIPRGKKDLWNMSQPSGDSQFAQYYLKPELAGLVNLLYPSLPDARTTDRSDLALILLNGLPGLNNTGKVMADELRLNTAIPACTSDPADDDVGSCRRLGAFYDDLADLAGWPNGRRLTDDVVDQAIRAVADGYGAQLKTLYGVPNLSPNNSIGDGVNRNDIPFLTAFPYIASPNQGYSHIHHGVMVV